MRGPKALLQYFWRWKREALLQVKEEGWLPQHVLLQDDQGRLLACCPLYLKGHSQGEYVFDHSWASSAYHMGIRYYPKLQSCSPFSPVTGARLLVRDSSNAKALTAALARTLLQVAGAAACIFYAGFW